MAPGGQRMKQKRVQSAAEAISGIFDGAVVMIGGFGRAGVAEVLLEAISEAGVRDLTIINNNSGYGETGIAKLVKARCVRKLICSFPWAKEAYHFREAYNSGEVDLEIVPQGTLAERIRAAGAGIGGFLTHTGLGTELAAGKQVVEVNRRQYLLELPLHADFALVRADKVDPLGNLTYRKAARNFNPLIAMAGKTVVVEANHEVPLGELDPECIVTPGIFVDRYFVRD